MNSINFIPQVWHMYKTCIIDGKYIGFFLEVPVYSSVTINMLIGLLETWRIYLGTTGLKGIGL